MTVIAMKVVVRQVSWSPSSLSAGVLSPGRVRERCIATIEKETVS
ncbi:hypothetical protein BJY24_000108 [Nocardia transvalensis]|uniref:Uncharacterized protein n=1 Tax=Nocardia transvalensis TaxID=37333 RepID=A0A7W9P847_9NOCA|nr:hypothetical protein [Nocardia transvalensis]MBB5911241.1 hypothetical protein [Nocardia transvalensis]